MYEKTLDNSVDRVLIILADHGYSKHDDEKECQLVDLLVDVRCYCEAHDIDTDDILSEAFSHYQMAKEADKAFEDDEE